MKPTALPSLILLALAGACTVDPPSTGDDGGDGTTGGTDSSAETETGEEQLTPIILDQAWVDALAGSWSGPVDPTPVGPVAFFPLDFAWDDDGSLHAHTDNPDGGYFDFRLLEQDGTWIFREEGQLPGGFTQSYDLHPIERDGNQVRFVTLEAPTFLVVDIEVSNVQLSILVAIAGNEHAAFELEG